MKTKNSDPISFEIRSNYELGLFQKPVGANYRNFPVRISIPVAPGANRPDQAMEVCDGNGGRVPASIRPFLLWSDGSVRAWEVWLHLTLKLGETQRFEFFASDAKSPAPVAHNLPLREPASFDLSVTLADGTRLEATSAFPARPSQGSGFVLEEEVAFPLRRDGRDLFRGVLKRRTWNAYAGSELTLRLTQVGPDDMLVIRGAQLRFDLPLQGKVEHTVQQLFHSRDRRPPWPRIVRAPTPFILRAEPGGIRVTDIKQLGDDLSRYPSYERPGAYVVSPWLAAGNSSATWLLRVDEAYERFPKQWTMDGARAVVDLHPEDAPALEWRQGMTMFQRLQLVRMAANEPGEMLDNEAWSWTRQPLVRLDADQYRAAGWRIPFRYEPKRFPKVENKFRELFRFPWYPGTFYWGDESDDLSLGAYLSLPPEKRPAARPRNGEYDITAASAKEYARTGRGEFLRMCRIAAEHLMYTDFVEVSHDVWKEGGVPAHGRNHTSGAAYPSHMWIEGLMLYHQLTGDPNAVRVGKRIGDFLLKYIHERFEVLKATAREGGWALIALGALYDLTREERYLEGIRRIADWYLSLKPAEFFPENGSYFVGIAMIGLDRVRPFHRDAEIKKFIPAVLDWQIEHRMTGEGLFDFHFDSETEGGTFVHAAMPEALNIGWLISGDERYLRVALRQFQFWEAGSLFHSIGNVPTDSRVAASAQLSWMGVLQTFAEKGWLERMQFPAVIG